MANLGLGQRWWVDDWTQSIGRRIDGYYWYRMGHRLPKLKYGKLGRILSINMVKGEQFNCPCGFSVTSPGGREDLMKHVMMHKEDRHPDMKMSQQQLESMIKQVDIVVMGPKNQGSMQKEETEAWRVQETIGKRSR